MFTRRVQSLDYGQGMSAVQEIMAVSIANEPYVMVDIPIGHMNDEMLTMQIEIASIISEARVNYTILSYEKLPLVITAALLLYPAVWGGLSGYLVRVFSGKPPDPFNSRIRRLYTSGAETLNPK